MTFRTLLAAATMLHAVPALAAIDPPAASGLDGRMRVVPYSRSNPVQLYAAPGASLRIQLGADEEVVQIVVSDQATIAPEEEAPAAGTAMTVSSTLSTPAPAQKGPASCDPNLCRSVAGNFVYLKPLRALDPQPLFIQTKRCAPEAVRCEMVPYTFELLTKAGDPKLTAAAAAWDVTFTYPDRDKAARLAEQRKAYAARVAAWRERQALRPPSPSAPGASANWRYGYRGSEAVRPDQAWDDGRTTFLRLNGNRRVPNVYRQLPDGHEGLASYATEPDAGGTVLRISRTEAKWFIRDGDAAGCLFNHDAGPAPAAEAVAAGGWDGMRGGTKLALGGVVVGGLIVAVVLPGMGQRAAPQMQNQEPRAPAKITEYEPPASRDYVQEAAKAAGLGALTGSTPAPARRRAVPTEMALFAVPVQPAAAAGTNKSAATGELGAGEPGGAGGGIRTGANGAADPDDRLAAHLTGASVLPTTRATLVRNAEFTIRAGETIPCLPIDAQNSGRPGFTSCRVPEWYRSSDQRRGLLPPGTRIVGQIRAGLAQGEMRLGVLYTQIQTPRFNIALAAPGADALGRAGLDGDLHTFFWDRAGSVALFALMYAAIGTGQNLASSALSRSFSGSNGTTLNLGSQAQGLASQEQASALNRQPVLTRDQAMPITVTVGQDLDFTAVCKEAMQIDPMACPLL